MAERIKLTGRAADFAKIAQGALVNGETIFPGGFSAPEGEYIIEGDELVPVDAEEKRRHGFS